MEYMIQWCLVCERRLEHQGLYCSPECLSKDFVVMGVEQKLPARTSAAKTNRVLSQTTATVPAKNMELAALLRIRTNPTRQRSYSIGEMAANALPAKTTTTTVAAGSNTSTIESMNSLPFLERMSASRASMNLKTVVSAPTVHEMQQRILCPAFSLEFQSRRVFHQPAPSSNASLYSSVTVCASEAEEDLGSSDMAAEAFNI
ncbi:hypothetical protein BJ741DRAFT_615642 [Chytriomyces cf. hyalinus JEL632]|nr:hypothetical protein BJ741DRAFT_615642 [Chytriomyces cf. hyalinus JEL632]